MAIRVWSFTVTGRFPFPTDMLRYDACWPVDTESASAISASIGDGRGTYTVRLATTGGPPTEARWSSFSWTVIETRRGTP